MTKETLNNSKLRDSASKIIFGNSVLCSQLLRGYVNIPILKDVQPEDIEDVSGRYVTMFEEERNADVVKKVHLKGNEMPFYLISLIEHKSQVDYNVVMQILRYMVLIWQDYAKEMDAKHKGISRTKDFKYPPILPIIYYEGASKWTASIELQNRVFLSDIMEEYIPNFKCILIQLNDYSNFELLEKKDELSIIMMINKLQEAAELAGLSKEVNAEYINDITSNSPEYLLNIMVQVIEALLMKLNVPREEIELFAGQIKERKMGELFENFKGYDVQATRREEWEKARNEGIEKLINILKELNLAKADVVEKLIDKYEMTQGEAREKVEKYW